MVTPRVLIVKLSSLGDLFHALPVTHCLKDQMNATIDWVTQPIYADLVHCFDDVENVITFPRKQFFTHAKAFVQTLRKYQYDYVLDLQGLLKSAIVTRMARSTWRIGPTYSREGSAFFYSARAGTRSATRRHAVDEALDVIRYLNLNPEPISFPVSFPILELPSTSNQRIAVAPCSRWITKNWAPEQFVETLQALQNKHPVEFYLIGGPDDHATCHYIETEIKTDIHNYCDRTNLVEMCSLIQAMDMVLSVDSGPMHVAAALNKPLLAIFGSTDPGRTGPYSEQAVVVSHGDLPCQPCHSRHCARKDIVCLEDLSAEKVIQTADSIIENILHR